MIKYRSRYYTIKAENYKDADQPAPLLFAYGSNRYYNDVLLYVAHIYASNFEEVDRGYWFRVVRLAVRLFVKTRAC